MNLINQSVVRQLQDVRQWAKVEIAAVKQPPWTGYTAKPFAEQRCPICHTFGCAGC